MSKKASIIKQVMDELESQRVFPVSAEERAAQPREERSRHAAKEKIAEANQIAMDEGRLEDIERTTPGIYSRQTYETYKRECCHFAHWVRDTHGVRDLGAAKEYVPDYLQKGIDDGKSAWTIKTQRSALAKIYHCKGTDFAVALPMRRREDITRSRHDVVSDKGFDPDKHRDYVDFCRGIGARAHEVVRIRPEDILRHDGDKAHIHRGKGGGQRDAIILPEYKERILEIAKSSTPGEPIFRRAPRGADTHGMRAQYARDLYAQHARDITTVPPAERYECSADKAGQVYDRQAMMIVSKSLGHGRIDVIARNYL